MTSLHQVTNYNVEFQQFNISQLTVVLLRCQVWELRQVASHIDRVGLQTMYLQGNLTSSLATRTTNVDRVMVFMK